MAKGDNWAVIGIMMQKLKKGTKWRMRNSRQRTVKVLGTEGTRVRFKVLSRVKGKENAAARDHVGDEKEMSSMAFMNSYRPE